VLASLVPAGRNVEICRKLRELLGGKVIDLSGHSVIEVPVVSNGRLEDLSAKGAKVLLSTSDDLPHSSSESTQVSEGADD
jgi:hypothetical protein